MHIKDHNRDMRELNYSYKQLTSIATQTEGQYLKQKHCSLALTQLHCYDHNKLNVNG